jgi:chorismate mutase/prephenate dehydratase
MARTPKDRIADLRRRIDGVDAEILRLLNDRMRVVEEIGAEKQRDGRPPADPGREREVVARLHKGNRGPLPNEAIDNIYREIFSAARSIEKVEVTAFLGPEATFSHLAAQTAFGRSRRFLPCRGIPEVFRAVEKGDCADGVVPVENSTEGTVSPTLDMLIDSPLAIVDELYLEVHHHLLSLEKDLGSVGTIYSHPQALAQCQEWLREKAPGIPLREVPSTAEAARLALSEPGAAAVAGEMAATLYRIPVLVRRIEDRFDNLTRFLVVGHDAHPPTGRDKTTLVFSIKDRVGALHRILAPLAEASVNLTRIESRPSRRKAWDYVFFLDLEGHRADARLADVLEKVHESCSFFRILGSYPDRRPAPAAP